MTATAIEIPPFFMPFAPRLHPACEEIERGHEEWIKAFNLGGENTALRDKLIRTRTALLAAYACDTGTVEVARSWADLGVWLFFVDDGYCENTDTSTNPGKLSIVLGQLMRVAECPRQEDLLPGDPLADALRDVVRRLEAFASPAQQQLWRDGIRAFFLASVQEAYWRSRNEVPTLDDFCPVRIETPGCRPLMHPLSEISYGARVGDSRHRPQLRALSEMALLLMGWDNDILSYPKELKQERWRVGLVEILRRREQLPLAQAMDKAMGMRNQLLHRYLELGRRLRGEDESTVAFVECCDAFVGGCIAWETTSQRYGLDGELGRVELSYDAIEPGNAPLPIPSISWWWDV
ncbi:terpene synthase family protein [Streptomyces sp. NPDC049555]|uniref:terpene synthase family protein n=1 Tax=unclassified Streptomyces TaxID=2593676 RepID=UPI0034305C8A